MIVEFGEMRGKAESAVQQEQYGTHRLLHFMHSPYYYCLHVLRILPALFIAQQDDGRFFQAQKTTNRHIFHIHLLS
jgi:hypothetical protein